MSRASIERRLGELSQELNAATEELRVLDEQIEHFAESADDARLRALVSETPLATREHDEATRTVSAMRRDRTVWADRVAEIERRQDELLDQMLETK